MNKDELTSLVREIGEMEIGDHYKGATMEAVYNLRVDSETVHDHPELAKFLGHDLTINGTWHSDYGFDSYDSVEIYKIVETIIPEKVIPAHTEESFVRVKFEDFQ